MERRLPNLRGLSLAELEAFFTERGQPRYRADQVFRRLHHLKARSAEEMTELPAALRLELDRAGAVEGLSLAHRAADVGGTEKFIVELPGGEPPLRQVEAVWIVAGDDVPGEGRRTVCISSQVGCSLDCTFCATGTLPFRGNLEAWQMVDQVYALERARNERASNVVFMGMGEPFHNYEEVLAAAWLLHDPRGAGLGARRITISTAGVVPAIRRFTEEEQPFNLAVSLNHPDPVARSRVMPLNDRHPLDELIAAVRDYTRKSGRRVTFEYVMMAGVNLDRRHADQLIAIAAPLRCKVNLIPLNTDLGGLRRPSAHEAAAFRERLAAAGVPAFDRGSPGRDVGGACGMLALERIDP
ncbi:MAG: 23S rRNA (adenine(2503)-C(2))-methyltransferase RlmN [Thermoanaerobaculia bacterium]|nr:23S rRNA (adenine(2503)-C(2))-methyltransferase RlmN [Thermoanaerobaculia bacterium]